MDDQAGATDPGCGLHDVETRGVLVDLGQRRATQAHGLTGARVLDVEVPVLAPLLDDRLGELNAAIDRGPQDQRLTRVIGGVQDAHAASPTVTEQPTAPAIERAEATAVRQGPHTFDVLELAAVGVLLERSEVREVHAVLPHAAPRGVEAHADHAGLGETARKQREEAPILKSLESMQGDHPGQRFRIPIDRPFDHASNHASGLVLVHDLERLQGRCHDLQTRGSV